MGQHRTAAPPDYDSDFFAWTQHQAKLLRALRRWPAEIPAELDLDRVAEEIEDLGSAELNERQEPAPADPGPPDQGGVGAGSRRRLAALAHRGDVLSARLARPLRSIDAAADRHADALDGALEGSQRQALASTTSRLLPKSLICAPSSCRTSWPRNSASMRPWSGCAAGRAPPDRPSGLTRRSIALPLRGARFGHIAGCDGRAEGLWPARRYWPAFTAGAGHAGHQMDPRESGGARRRR